MPCGKIRRRLRLTLGAAMAVREGACSLWPPHLHAVNTLRMTPHFKTALPLRDHSKRFPLSQRPRLSQIATSKLQTTACSTGVLRDLLRETRPFPLDPNSHPLLKKQSVSRRDTISLCYRSCIVHISGRDISGVILACISRCSAKAQGPRSWPCRFLAPKPDF